MKVSVTPQDVVDLLNEMLRIDPKATTALMHTHVDCNHRIAEHPTIQVRDDQGEYLVGLLGILNGLFSTGKDDRGFITMVEDMRMNIKHFEVTDDGQTTPEA